MTSEPTVPLRLELTFELPGTPEQVWHAIATAGGISSWFLPTDVEEREGGAVCFHMGDADSPGTVTGWDPPHRFAYEEPNWATFTDHDSAGVTPLATEFLVEAQSGGTCVVRVVSSAFGTGEDWEQEFFDEMRKGWLLFFDNLRLYLSHFADRTATTFQAGADVPGEPTAVLAAMRRELGAEAAGQTVQVRGLTARTETLGELHILLRSTDPVPGYLTLFSYDNGKGQARAQVYGYLFSEAAESFVRREQPGWQEWLGNLAVPA